jgi:hypothetical protein
MCFSSSAAYRVTSFEVASVVQRTNLHVLNICRLGTAVGSLRPLLGVRGFAEFQIGSRAPSLPDRW